MADDKEPAASKPVIITHRAVLQEPSSASTDSATPDVDVKQDTKPVAKPSTAIKLKPLEGTPKANASEDDNSSKGESIKVKTGSPEKATNPPAPKTIAEIKAPETSTETKTPEPSIDKGEDKPEPDTNDKPEEAPTESGDAESSSDEPDSGKPVDPAATEAEEAKQAEHDAAVQKLADSKQYYLPINAVEKRKTKRFVALGVLLSLVLIVFWIDIAMDAGLVHLSGIKPVTHFFSN